MRILIALSFCLSLLLPATFIQAAGRFPIEVRFENPKQNVKLFKRKKSANVTLDRIVRQQSPFFRLAVDPNTPTAAAMTRDLNLVVGKYNVMRITMTYRTHDLNRGKVKMIAYTMGGKLPGNRVWHVTDAPLDTSNWVQTSTYLTIPQDAKKLHVRLMLDAGSGVVDLKNIRLDALNHNSEQLKPITLNFPQDTARYRTFSPLHLGVNMVFSLPGAYYGTLPVDHPQSQRLAFIKQLHQAGFQAVRFPGGTQSHWYLAGYPKQNKTLLKRKDANNKKQNHSAFPHGHITRWENVRQTFKQAKIKIIYQLNTSTFVDDHGKILPVLENKFTRRLGVADGKDHLQTATNALARDFEKGIFAAGQVDVWELGNEEHAKMTVEQYASIVNAYTRVLMKFDPQTPVCFSGHWEVLKHVDADVVKHLSAETSHYPFAKWPRPYPPQATSDLIQMSQSHVDMGKSCHHYAEHVAAGRRPAHMKLAVTETGIYKYFTYDPFKATSSFAHALAFAGNWPEMISEPIVNIAVLHDLESIFFGSLMYNVKFKPSLRQFSWIKPGEFVSAKPEKPMPGAELKKTFYFPNAYVPMPTTRVVAMLSQMVNTRIAHAPSDPSRQLTGNLIGISDDKVYLFICNPTDKPQRAELNLPASINPLTKGTWQSVQADHVYAVLDSEYREINMEAPNLSQTQNHLLLPACSVNLLIFQ